MSGNLGILDLITAIADIFGLIMTIGETAVMMSKDMGTIEKQIKNAKSKKQRKKLIKQQKELIKKGCGKGLVRIAALFSTLAFIGTIISYVVSWQQDSILFVEFVVTIIIEIISIALCSLTEVLVGLIPTVGIILGFAFSWVVGGLLAMYFNDQKISEIAEYCDKKLHNLTSPKKWFSYFSEAAF